MALTHILISDLQSNALYRHVNAVFSNFKVKLILDLTCICMCTCTDADGEGNWNSSQGVCIY